MDLLVNKEATQVSNLPANRNSGRITGVVTMSPLLTHQPLPTLRRLQLYMFLSQVSALNTMNYSNP